MPTSVTTLWLCLHTTSPLIGGLRPNQLVHPRHTDLITKAFARAYAASPTFRSAGKGVFGRDLEATRRALIRAGVHMRVCLCNYTNVILVIHECLHICDPCLDRMYPRTSSHKYRPFYTCMTTADSEDEGGAIRKRQRSAAARAARMVTADRYIYVCVCMYSCVHIFHASGSGAFDDALHTHMYQNNVHYALHTRMHVFTLNINIP